MQGHLDLTSVKVKRYLTFVVFFIKVPLQSRMIFLTLFVSVEAVHKQVGNKGGVIAVG
jgi:hypothetical protein